MLRFWLDRNQLLDALLNPPDSREPGNQPGNRYPSGENNMPSPVLNRNTQAALVMVPRRDVPVPVSEPYPAWMEKYRWALMVGSFILVATVALSIAAMRSSNSPPSARVHERLRVDSRQGQWLIRWNADTAAERATLIVGHDAETQTINLTPNLYAGASLLLPQHSRDLDVLLRTEWGGKAISEVRTRVVAVDHAAAVPTSPTRLRKRRKH